MKTESDANSSHPGEQYLGKPFPLLAAADKSDLPAVADLVEHYEQNIEQKNSLNNTAIILAASKGNIEMVEYLLSKGASLKTMNKSLNGVEDYLKRFPHADKLLTRVLLEKAMERRTDFNDVTSLNFNEMNVHKYSPKQIDDLAEALAKLPKLTKLNLRRTDLHAIDQARFTALCRLISGCQGLTELNLNGAFRSPYHEDYQPVPRERITELAESVVALVHLQDFKLWQLDFWTGRDLECFHTALVRGRQKLKAYTFLNCYQRLREEADQNSAVETGLEHLPGPLLNKILLGTHWVGGVRTEAGVTKLNPDSRVDYYLSGGFPENDEEAAYRNQVFKEHPTVLDAGEQPPGTAWSPYYRF